MPKKYRQFSTARPRPSSLEVMRRFLNDCLQPNGRIEINQPIQYRTWVRAVEQGYITETGVLLDKGKLLIKGDSK